MSMPSINIEHIDRHIALNNIMASIALQETALAHILNADGEKLQLAVSLTDPTGLGFTGRYSTPGTGAKDALDDLLSVNNSVNELVDTVQDLESLLRGKLDTVLGYLNPSLNLAAFAKVTVHVEDASNIPIANSQIKVTGFSSSGTAVNLTFTTNDDGDAIFTLPDGQYTVTQVTTKAGLALSVAEYPLTIENDGKYKINNADGPLTITNLAARAGSASDDSVNPFGCLVVYDPNSGYGISEGRVPVQIAAARRGDGSTASGLTIRVTGTATTSDGPEQVDTEATTDEDGVVTFLVPANSTGVYHIEPISDGEGGDVLTGDYTIHTDAAGPVSGI